MADSGPLLSHSFLVSSQPLLLVLQEYESHPYLNKSLVGKQFSSYGSGRVEKL